MVEIKDGVLINPDSVAYIMKRDLISPENGDVIGFGIDIYFNTFNPNTLNLFIRNFNYNDPAERDRIYNLLRNETKAVRLTNTVTTAVKRNWDL